MKKAAFLFVFILACNFIVAQDFNYYIKFDGIPGELTDGPRKDWCDLESFDQQVRSKVRSGPPGPRRETPIVTGKTVSVIKKIDKSSPKVMETLTGGKIISKVEIEVTIGGSHRPRVIYRYELKNVVVTKYSVLAEELEWPMEEITLQFEEQKVRYTWYKNDGQLGGHIDTEYK